MYVCVKSPTNSRTIQLNWLIMSDINETKQVYYHDKNVYINQTMVCSQYLTENGCGKGLECKDLHPLGILAQRSLQVKQKAEQDNAIQEQ